MRLKTALALLLLPAGWTLPAALQAPGMTAEEAALRLEQRLRGLRSLQAEFEQTYRPASLASPLVEKGRLFFRGPDRMRWEYIEPEVKVFLYREGLFEQYYPEDKQLIRTRISQGDSGAEILSLLTGAKKIGDDYALELTSGPETGNTATRLKLTPRREEEFRTIFLDVNRATFLLDQAVFVDFSGNRTEFRFKKARTDAPLSPDVFTLKVPEGCEVIEDLAPRRT